MTKKMKWKEIVSNANKIKKGVEKDQKVPTIPGFSAAEVINIFSKAVRDIHKDKETKSATNATNPTGTGIYENLEKDEYILVAKNVGNYIEKNSKTPNYTVFKDQLISNRLIEYCLAKIIVWYDEHGNKMPNSCLFDNSVFYKKSTKTDDEICNYFIKVFGKVTTFTDALRKIYNKGYGYYFENCMKNKAVIDGLAKSGGKKPNCVDICQMMWHVAKGLGYDVRCLQVWCPVSKITHVRLQVKHSKYTSGKWENYDPAAVADGESINSLWCSGSGSYTIATNPNWFTSGLNE